jgi:integrase
LALRDNESKVFSSRKSALTYLAGAKRSPRLEETYYVCRGWELIVQSVPLLGEQHLDYESYGGVKLQEREFVIKGSNKEDLLRAAEARRRASFARNWTHFTKKENLAQLSRASRPLALESIAGFYSNFDHSEEVEANKKQKVAREAAEQEKEAAIPTVGNAVDMFIEDGLRKGTIQSNVAQTYRYEAKAFSKQTFADRQGMALADIQIHKLTDQAITNWFEAHSSQDTKFGRPPSSKTLINVLTHLQATKKFLSRSSEWRPYLDCFRVVDGLLEDLRSSKRDADGWRKRSRLTNDQISKLLGACETDLERGAVALMLAGPRPPSEPVAVRWDHLEYLSGHLWWHVCSSVIELSGGQLDIREHTKTKDADFRQLSICKGLAQWLEPLRGRSEFVLGSADGPLRPSEFVTLVESLLDRAKVRGTRISTYSIRHTVSDELDRLLGPRARDLVLHGKRDKTTGGIHYSHAERDRRRSELTFDGKPYGEHMVWAEWPNF